jgi:UrcA family protein
MNNRSPARPNVRSSTRALTSRFLAPVFALALAAASAHAQASDVRQHYAFDGQSIVAETAIPYRDLDLGSEAGVRTMRQRIEAAADAVCGDSKADDAYRRQAFLLCRDVAIRSAIARLPASGQARQAVARSAAASR